MAGPDGWIIPPARNFASIVNAASRVYSYRSDEAMRDNFVRARAMRRDAFLRGLIEERILPTINRKYQLRIPDDRDRAQVHVRESLKGVVESIPQFAQFKRAMLDGVWFGKAGCQWGFARDRENDHRWGIPKWDPLHGDSIQYTYDGVPAVLLDSMTSGWYSNHGATWGPNGDLRPTDRGGTALVLGRPHWRCRFGIYQHIREKADYFEGELAGSVQGLGLRGLVYWAYVIRTEALTWMLTYMQSVGQMDLLIFNYPAGDNAAKLKQEANAAAIIGKAAIACPRNPTQNWPAVEQVKMNSEGLKALHSLLNDYMDRHIERLVVGQSMSSGADNDSGLGGTGRAEFSMMTKDEILSYDTTVFDEVMTRDVLGPLKAYNFPWARFPVKFESVMPDLEKSERVTNGQVLIQCGVEIKKDEFREAGGYSRPEEGDETVGGPQPGMDMGMPPGMGPPGFPPDAQNGVPPPNGVPGGFPPGGEQTPPGGPPGAVPPETEYGRLYDAPPFRPGQPTRFDGGGGTPGGAAAGPAMGYPGGGNTYVSGFGRHRRPIGPLEPTEPTVGFTRRTDFSDLPRRWSAGGGRWEYVLTEDHLRQLAGGGTQYSFPVGYTTDKRGVEHKPPGEGGGQFAPHGGGGNSGHAAGGSGGEPGRGVSLRLPRGRELGDIKRKWESTGVRVPLESAAGLSGALPGDQVELSGELEAGVVLYVVGKKHDATLELDKGPDGPVLTLADIRVAEADQKGGVGTEVFRSMVRGAAAAGVKRVECRAVREPGKWGHYTWPRLGFDQPLDQFPADFASSVRQQFPDAESVLDVFDRPGGKEWWKQHGQTMRKAVFDLSPGSRSMKVFEAYVGGKGKRTDHAAGRIPFVYTGPWLPIDYKVQHAPPGGVTIGSKHFVGGQFIPGDVLARATPAEKAAVEGRPAAGAAPGRPSGNVGGGARDDLPPRAFAPTPEQLNPSAPDRPAAVARVGVPAPLVPPPPDEIPRLPHLEPDQRAVETRFADTYLADPDGMTDKYLRALATRKVGEYPNVFATDDVKALNPDWNPGGGGPDGLSPQQKTAMARYNAAVHQTANAVAKRAFVRYLDGVVSRYPPGDPRRSVLVTNGGCAAGKGSSLARAGRPGSTHAGMLPVPEQVGCIWDAAGEQNATENAWVYNECAKRGIPVTFVYVHADPAQRWEGGVIPRAMKKGRMVDARLFADSYANGARNMDAFHRSHAGAPGASFIFLDNRDKGNPRVIGGVPPDALRWDSDDIYRGAVAALQRRAVEVGPGIVAGGLGGVKIWGMPT